MKLKSGLSKTSKPNNNIEKMYQILGKYGKVS